MISCEQNRCVVSTFESWVSFLAVMHEERRTHLKVAVRLGIRACVCLQECLLLLLCARETLTLEAHTKCLACSDALNTGSLSVLLHMAKSQPRAYREMLQSVMQEHFSSEHGLVEDLSAARRKRAKAGRGAYDNSARTDNGGQASPKRNSVSPLRSPVRDGRGVRGARKSTDDEEIVEVQRALKHYGVGESDRNDDARQGVHASHVNGEDEGAGPHEFSAHGDGSQYDMSLDIGSDPSLFFDHVAGKRVGGWGGAQEEQIRKQVPLRQILPAYLKAVPGGGSGVPKGGKGAQGRLAKNAVHGSFARATANEYGGHDTNSRGQLKQRRKEMGNRNKVPRIKSHLGVNEDLIARTWAAPDFDDGSNDDSYEGVKSNAWGEIPHCEGRRGQDPAIQRPRSADVDLVFHTEPLLLDSMMINPSGIHSTCNSISLWRHLFKLTFPLVHR